MKISSASYLELKTLSKPYYLSEKARNNAKKLIKMMDDSAKYSINPDKTTYTVEMLTSINIGEKVKFSNNRHFFPMEYKTFSKDKFPDFSIKIGKNILDINCNTGEVIRAHLGIFSRIKKLLSKAEDLISEMITDFSNPEVVTKNTFSLQNNVKKCT